MKKDVIKIRSSLGGEFNSEVSLGGERYFVQTETGGPASPCITTRVYLNGRIIYTKETDCSGLANVPDREEKIRELMRRQQQLAISILKTEKMREEKSPSDYLEEVRAHIARKDEAGALRIVAEALAPYPDNPFLLSYHGYLDAVVKRNFRDGIAACRRAVETLKKTIPFGEEFFYPFLYLNLGKAYLAAEKKKDAINAFQRGLDADPENREILNSLRELGVRKKPSFPFLRRSHLLNKYAGMIRHRIGR